MTKIILPPHRERALVKWKIARLAERKAKIDLEYHQESERLQARLRELEPPTRPEVSEDDLPSFMRSTLGSRVRTAQSPQNPTAKQEDTPHRPGVPKKRNPPGSIAWWAGPSYAQSTVSSCGKTTSAITRRCQPPFVYRDPGIYPDDPPRDPNFHDDYWVNPDDEPILNPTDRQVAERVYNGISIRTRLDDNDWAYEGLSGEVWIPAQLNYELMGDGLKLAREGFWEFCRERIPDLWKSSYHMGPSSVRFGFSELDSFNVHDGVKTADPSCRVWWALRSLTQVRNSYCHFRGGDDSQSLELALKIVQKLLVAVGDEERAMRARGLRDQLKEAAEQSLAELRMLGLMSSLPHHGGLDWAPHHERFFWYKVENFKRNNPKELAIIQAIETWSERRYKPGMDREGFEVEDDQEVI